MIIYKSQILGLIQLARPKQWIKNIFVLAPLLFTGLFLDHNAISAAFNAFLLFCLASSATYIINDISDLEDDKQHPRKSLTRPLAAGKVTIPQALILLALLYTILVWNYFLTPEVVLVITAYLVLNIAYTFVLKHQPVLDIFTISIGFVLRVYAGAVALNVPVSPWMFVTTLALALFLASIKRRQEIILRGDMGRKVLRHYSAPLVTRFAEISATSALLFYSLFVLSARQEMVLTISLVLFGLFRYWYIVESHDAGESPTDVLLGDWQLIITIVLWVISCIWFLWPSQV